MGFGKVSNRFLSQRHAAILQKGVDANRRSLARIEANFSMPASK